MTTDRTRASAGSRTGDPASTRQDTPFNGDVVILNRRAESDTVVSLELGTATAKPLPPWEPGAHIDVVLPDGLTRQYSLTGRMHNQETWRIGVLREPDSRGGSQWIHERAWPGARLHVRGPRNNFPLRAAPRYLFIAGGIGITPLLPMAAEADASGADWTLHYVGRARNSMAFLGELAPFGGRVAVWPGNQGSRLDLAAALAPPAEPILVYCCGPARLIEAVEAHCRTWPAGSLHVERFTAASPAAERGNKPVEVKLHASGMTITVPPELTILEAVENAGVPVLSSCSEGTCGTCETLVLEGEVDHRDSVLSAEERAASDTMMICVSRAKRGRLVLDL